jgi:hypothetical protein
LVITVEAVQCDHGFMLSVIQKTLGADCKMQKVWSSNRKISVSYVFGFDQKFGFGFIPIPKANIFHLTNF